MNNRKIFPQSLKNLNKYDVFVVDNYRNPSYYNVQMNFDSLTYGKNYIKIGLFNKTNVPYTPKLSSEVQIEVIDKKGNPIFYELVENHTYDYWSAFYIRIDETFHNTYETIEDGDNAVTVTILGELTDNIKKIPKQWVDVYNVKMVIPLKLDRNKKNISPLYFNVPPVFDVVEDIFYDKLSELYSRSYANVIIDNIHTIGGKIGYGEISYLTNTSKANQKEILNTFEMERSGSGTETLRQHISNATMSTDIVGLDDMFDTGPGSGSQWIGDFTEDGQASYNQPTSNWRAYALKVQRISQDFIDGTPYVTMYDTETSVGYSPVRTTNISKIFRHAYDEEEYEISYRVSGSGGIQIKESSYDYGTYLTQSLETLDGTQFNTVFTIYSQSFNDFNPLDNQTWTSSYDNDGLKRSDIILSGSSSHGAIITGSFVISSGSYACIYANPKHGVLVGDYKGSFADISIVPKVGRGNSPPFYHHKIQLPPMSRRDQVYDFNLKLMNPNMDPGKTVVDDNNILINQSNDFAGSPITVEKPDTIFVASNLPEIPANLSQAFLIAGPGAKRTKVGADQDQMGVFIDSTYGGLVFGKDNLETSNIAMRQSGSESMIIISGSVRDNTFLRVQSGSSFTTIYPDSIESENYIISSSISYYTSSTYTGTTTFGDSLDDIHSFTGSLNVSNSLTIEGDISASGNLYLQTTKGFNLNVNPLLAVTHPDNQFQFNRGVIVDGDISASGDLYIGDDIFLTSTNAKIWNRQEDAFLSFPDSSITIDGDNYVNIYANGGTNFVDGNVGIGTSVSSIPPKTLTVQGDISASGHLDVVTVSASANIYAPNIGTGQDPSVVILDLDGTFKTDEINTAAWAGATIPFLSGDSSNLTDNYIPYTSDGDMGLMDDTNLYWASNKLGIGTGAVTLTKTLTVEGSISASGGLFLESSASIGTTVQKGMFTVDYGNATALTGSLSNGEGYGDIISYLPLESSVVAGDVVKHHVSEWRQADKDNEIYTSKMLGVALEDYESGVNKKVLLRGFVRLAAGHISDAGDEGDPLYVGDDGHVTFAIPGSGDFARIVGYCINEADDIIYFDPDKTWVEIA